MGLSQIGPYLSDDETVQFFKFLLSGPLGDLNVNVRSSMLEAATAIIASHKQVMILYFYVALNMFGYLYNVFWKNS